MSFKGENDSSDVSYTLHIKLSSGYKFTITMPLPPPSNGFTVEDVKRTIHEEHPETPISSQKLIYKGRILDNSKSLEEYDIIAECTIFLVVSNASHAPQMTTESETPSSAASNLKSSASSSSATTTRGPPPPPDTLAALMQNMLGGGSESSANGSNNRNSQPSNPQLQQMLNDPSALQQAMEMMRNPEALQQAMRQQDLAMSQLENMPGGFSALRSMYDSVNSLEESFMPAERNTSSNSGRPAGESAREDAGAAGMAMPNPWGSRTGNSNNNNNRSSNTNNQGPATRSNPPLPGNMTTESNPFLQAIMNSGSMPFAPGTTGTSATVPALPSFLTGQQPPPAEIQSMLNSPMINQMMQQFVRGNPDMVREMLQQHDPLLGQFLNSMPREQANEFIQNVIANPPPADLQSLLQQDAGNTTLPPDMSALLQGGLTGANGNAEDLIQQLMQNPSTSAGFSPEGVMSGLFQLTNNRQSNPWANVGENVNETGEGNRTDNAPTLPLSLDVASLSGTSTPGLQQQQQPPDVRFQRQLQSLRDMGFDQDERSIQALLAVGGNINRAVEWLLANIGSSEATDTTSPNANDATD